LTENKGFHFLRMFSQPIDISGCYFEWLDHCVILVISIARLLNITPIFSMYFFIIFCSSCLTLVRSYFGLGIVIFSCVSWFFWLVFDYLLSILVIEAYNILDWTYLICIFADSIRVCDSGVSTFLRNVGKKFLCKSL